MFQQNPYEANFTSDLQSVVAAQLPLIGIAKAFVLWGGSFIVTATALLLIQCYSKFYLCYLPVGIGFRRSPSSTAQMSPRPCNYHTPSYTERIAF